MNETSKSKHILDLVKDLLEDIELDRSSGDKLILKASRLARIVDAEEIKEWLRFELSGFKRDNDTSIKYMGITGRWIKRDDNKGYWITLAAIEAIIETENFKLKIMQNPNLSGGLIVREINKISKDIVKLTQIKGKIMSCLHTFVTDVYYEKMFDHLSESIFESYKRDVDNLIYSNCSDLLKQIPSEV